MVIDFWNHPSDLMPDISLIYLLLTGKVPTEEQLPIIEDVLQSVREELEDRLDFLEEQTENFPDYEKTILLLMDRGLTYHPIVQEMMELDTQYYNLED